MMIDAIILNGFCLKRCVRMEDIFSKSRILLLFYLLWQCHMCTVIPINPIKKNRFWVKCSILVITIILHETEQAIELDAANKLENNIAVKNRMQLMQLKSVN